MNILIIDIDSTIPNLALHKIAKFHKDKQDQIYWNLPIMAGSVDQIYVSCVFNWNRHKCLEWEDRRAYIGGTGYDLSQKLPDEIEAIKPKINLGFTMRGCTRNCDFCVVPKKEGRPQVVGDLLDLWDGHSKDVTILDNNILSDIDHFNLICEQAQRHKIRVDFNQGIDHRYLTPDVVKTLKKTPHKEYRLAFDSPAYKNRVSDAIRMLQHGGINRCSWYVLVGYNTTLNEDLDRLFFLRENNQNAYVQRYKKEPQYIPIARWANQHHIFQAMTWDVFINRPENKKYKHYFQ